jgi:hypothetical protein
MTFFKWEGKPKKRVLVETVGNQRILHVDASEAMRVMEARIAKMTPEEIARNEAEADRLEAEFEAEQDDEQADVGGAVREPKQPSPGAAERLNVYLGADYREQDFEDGGLVVMDGFRPFFDRGCTQRLDLDDEELIADRVFYCRLAGGTHYQADLQRPEFEVGEQVFILREPTNAFDPHALLVTSTGTPVYNAGHIPRELAAALAPLIAVSKAGKGIIVETVTSGGVRTGLRIVGSVGREMFVESVPSTKG